MTEPNRNNRYDVPFDDCYFKKLADGGVALSIEETFSQIYQSNFWNGNDSVSGNGSDLRQTEEIAKHLPLLIKEFEIKTIRDLPCGYSNWLSRIDPGVEEYTGGDIVAEIIEMNRKLYSDEKHDFLNLDITRGFFCKRFWKIAQLWIKLFEKSHII